MKVSEAERAGEELVPRLKGAAPDWPRHQGSKRLGAKPARGSAWGGPPALPRGPQCPSSLRQRGPPDRDAAGFGFRARHEARAVRTAAMAGRGARRRVSRRVPGRLGLLTPSPGEGRYLHHPKFVRSNSWVSSSLVD